MTLPPVTPAPAVVRDDLFSFLAAGDVRAVANVPVRRLITLYIVLWVFEGSFRKWLLPELSTPLLVVRDPVLLGAYFLAVAQGRLLLGHPLVVATMALGVLQFLASLLLADSTGLLAGRGVAGLDVMLYGLRSNFLHLPLILLAPQYFDRRDVERLGRWALWLAAPMAVLVLWQFQSPRDAWINVAAGGEGIQMETSMGHIRPPGTFSFTNGLVSYLTLCVSFLCHQLLKLNVFSRRLTLAASIAAAIMLGLSGSRSAIGATVTVWIIMLYVCIHRPEYARSSGRLLAAVLVGFVMLNVFSITRTGLDVLEERLGDAENVRTGMVMRYLSNYLAPFEEATRAPAFGYGLGLGTNAGAALATGATAQRAFLLAEGDFARVVLESGPVLGFAFIALRVAFTFLLLRVSLAALDRQNNPLPFMMFAACWDTLLGGQFGQPTALGFAVISGGLCLAAARPPADDEDAPSLPTAVEDPAAAPRRGRSAYADLLHGQRG